MRGVILCLLFVFVLYEAAYAEENRVDDKLLLLPDPELLESDPQLWLTQLVLPHPVKEYSEVSKIRLLKILARVRAVRLRKGTKPIQLPSTCPAVVTCTELWPSVGVLVEKSGDLVSLKDLIDYSERALLAELEE